MHFYTCILLSASLLAVSTNGQKICKSLTLESKLESPDVAHVRLTTVVGGCTHVSGNVILQDFRKDDNYHLANTSFLDSIVEISGSLRIFNLAQSVIEFKNLKIIRGDDVFYYWKDEENSSLSISNLPFDNQQLSFPKLRHIQKGNVFLTGRFSLSAICFLKKVQWSELFTTTASQVIYNYNNGMSMRISLADGTIVNDSRSLKCDAYVCHSSCPVWTGTEKHCWNPTQQGCQISSRCKKRQCDFCYMYNGEEECCDAKCSGGCYGRGPNNCHHCEFVENNGTCYNKCPGQDEYEESRRTGAASYTNYYRKLGGLCFASCPEYFVEDSTGKFCQEKCPSTEYAHENKCVSCSRIGNKDEEATSCSYCELDGFYYNEAYSAQLKSAPCAVVTLAPPQSSLAIDGSKEGNFSLDNLVYTTIIIGKLTVQKTEVRTNNLSFLRNLQTVTGQFAVVQVTAKYLGLSSLKSANPLVLMSINGLCPAWYPSTYLNSKGLYGLNARTKNIVFDTSNTSDCVNATCDSECAGECWGPGPEMCVACRGVTVAKRCYATCQHANRYWKNETARCEPCDAECKDGCSGPGTGTDVCVKCAHVSQDGLCLSQCTKGFVPEVGTGFCYSSFQSKITGLIVGFVVAAIIFTLAAVIGCFYYNKMAHKYDVVDFDDLLVKPINESDMSRLLIVNDEDLTKEKQIGVGAFGVVFRGFLNTQTRKGYMTLPVAIKVLKGTNPKLGKELLDEAAILGRIQHIYCIRLVGICMTDEIQLITPLMPRGCLLEHLRSKQNKIGPRSMLNWAFQIAEGMSYLEESKIVHRDLAARNILLESLDHVRITDFGLAKLLNIAQSEYQHSTGILPVKWLGIECFESGSFTHKSDVWAYAVLLWEICTFGSNPYDGYRISSVVDISNILRKGIRLSQPENCTIEFYNVMLSCWLPFPEARPTFKDLAHTLEQCLKEPAKYLVAVLSTSNMDTMDGDNIPMRSRAPNNRDIDGYSVMSQAEPDVKVKNANHYVEDPSNKRGPKKQSILLRNQAPSNTNNSAIASSVPASTLSVDDGGYLEPSPANSALHKIEEADDGYLDPREANATETDYLMPKSPTNNPPLDDYLVPTANANNGPMDDYLVPMC